MKLDALKSSGHNYYFEMLIFWYKSKLYLQWKMIREQGN